MEEDKLIKVDEKALFSEVREIIEKARSHVSRTVNTTLVIMNWQIGNTISIRVLGGERAEYGKKVIANLSQKLTREFGRGYSRQTLFHCLRVAETFPDFEIVSAMGRQLSWTHFKTLAYIGDPLKREFYTALTLREGWGTKALPEKIESMLFERTAISKKPEELISQELALLKEDGKMSPDLVFRDPYILDFLDLKDTYSEKDLESAILAELQRFISELGTDFAFLARQKQINIDNEPHRIDLLFFHRGLRRLFAIDLKLGKFQARDKGQMELYLRWLEKYEMREGEERPLGLILCAEKSREKIELLQLDKGNIRVAEYITALPPRKLLEEKLHRAIMNAKQRLSSEEE